MNIEDIRLIDKRDVIHNKFKGNFWKGHFIMTFNKEPQAICLNIKKLGEMSEDKRVDLLVRVLNYFYG